MDPLCTNHAKIMKPTSLLAATCAGILLTTTAAQASDLQVFTGPVSQPGSLVRFDESSGAIVAAPAELQGVRLLPLVLNGQAGSAALRSDKPRWKDEPPGLGRISLPGRGGSLYRFVRHESSGARTFGFLRVLPDASVLRVAERPGTGPLQQEDPYLDRVAFASDSRSFLLGTTHAAGGDVLELHLDSGALWNHTPHFPPLHLKERSLRMAGSWCVAAADEGLLRGDAGPTGILRRVSGVPPAALVTGELVLSPNGTRALATLGSDAAHLDAWAFGRTGDGLRMNAVPAQLMGAGFAPEAPHGPFLAISDDGQWAGWTSVIQGKRELFMRERPQQATPIETHVTSDALFADTLEEIGVLGMFVPGELWVAVGEVAPIADGGIENADFFRVRLDASGAPQLENLSLTSGQQSAPFMAPPQLSPSHMTWLPEVGAYLMFDDLSGGNGRLITVTPGVPGVQVVMPGIKDVDFIERVGQRLVFSLRVSSGQQQHQIVKAPADLSAPPTVLLNGGDDPFLHPVGASGRWIIFQEVPDIGPRRLSRVRLLNGLYESFPVLADEFGAPVGQTASGTLTFSFLVGGVPRVATWPFGGGTPQLLQVPGGEGTLVPGR